MKIQRITACLLIATASLLTACGGGGGNASRTKDVDHALAYLPDDALVVMSVSVDRVLASDMWKKLEAEVPGFDKSLGDIRENVGIAPSEVSRLTMAVLSLEEGDLIAVVQTKRDVSIEDVKKIKDFKDLSFTASKVGGADVYSAGPFPFTLHFPDARTLVVGKATAMSKMLNRSAPSPTANMKASLELARFDKAVTVVTSMKGMPKEMKDKMMNDAPAQAKPIISMLISANTMSFNADVTDMLDVAIEVDFAEVANAESMNNMVEGLKAFALASGDIPAEATELINQIKPETDGTTFRVGAKIDPNVFIGPMTAARNTATTLQSMNQMRGIGQACLIASQSNNGKFPASIGAIFPDEYFTVEYVISPRADATIPADFASWAMDKKVSWINANTSYCYVTGLKDDNDPKKIVLFERLTGSTVEKVPVYFSDGHVEQLSVAEASRRIKQQTGRTLEQWSEAPNPGAGGQ